MFHEVLTPFRHIPVHVKQPPAIGQFAAAVLGPIRCENGVLVRKPSVVPKAIVGDGPCATGVFPFRFGR